MSTRDTSQRRKDLGFSAIGETPSWSRSIGSGMSWGLPLYLRPLKKPPSLTLFQARAEGQILFLDILPHNFWVMCDPVGGRSGCHKRPAAQQGCSGLSVSGRRKAAGRPPTVSSAARRSKGLTDYFRSLRYVLQDDRLRDAVHRVGERPDSIAVLLWMTFHKRKGTAMLSPSSVSW